MSRQNCRNDPETAALFIQENPENVFTDLQEIGHGSFGAVYYARNIQTKEIVAIKKMSYQGRQTKEKWMDIVKEVKFLRLVKNKHCIEYKGCYLRDHTAWLVMDYCLGSASDIVEVHKKPLHEDEIGAICAQALLGLEYLHSRGHIHRDIKAGNILLTDNGCVKLADFGSASIACPANSFVGTPYWMAPEVISAMDDGQYDGKADIWSLGITCIELAERKPPLFNMNAMSALYHIVQNDSPNLTAVDIWSSDFVEFVNACLRKEPSSRLSVSGCLQHTFIVKNRSPTVLPELIQRTRDAVRELEHLAKSRFLKLIADFEHTDNGETSEANTAIQDEADGADETGAKSNSVGSRASLQSTDDFCANSASSTGGFTQASTAALSSFAKDEPPSPAALSTSSSVSTRSQQTPEPSIVPRHVKPGPNNFATLRTISMVTKEQRKVDQENMMKQQMSGFKQMRKTHLKQLHQMEYKCRVEMDDHKQRLDKEYEALLGSQVIDLKAVEMRHDREKEKFKKDSVAEETRLRGRIEASQVQEMKQLTQQQKKDYLRHKQDFRKQLPDTPPRSDTIRTQKESLKQQHAEVEQNLAKQQQQFIETEVRKLQRKRLLKLADLEKRQLEEFMEKRQSLLDVKRQTLKRHHEMTRELEERHQQMIHSLRDEQTTKQHQTELSSQSEYTSRANRDLKRKHCIEVKQLPKNLKGEEEELKRQFQTAIKGEQKDYKQKKETILMKTPKGDQKEALTKLKDELNRRLLMLGETYQTKISDLFEQENIKVDASHSNEKYELQQRLEKEEELLLAYQNKILQQNELQHQREKKELEQKVALRLVLLNQKLDDEEVTFAKERAARNTELLDLQTHRLQEFDLCTTTMGLDLLQIVQETQDSYRDPCKEDIVGSDLSFRGSSVQNLSGSVSLTAFNRFSDDALL